MHRVAVLAYDGVIPFELGIPARLFNAATAEDGSPLYEVVTCSPGGRPVRTAADFAVLPDHDLSILATADTVVFPPVESFAKIAGPEDVPDDLREALARIRPDARIVSICLASFVLAAAGLLDGRTATTHWRQADRFQRLYPSVEMDADVLFVDADRVFTSAGAAAGVDLCLHLIRQDHGSSVANLVARRLVVPPWREGGQAQFIERPVPAPSDAGTAPTRAWALERLHTPLQLDDLADHAGMSRRTFTRRFRAEVGVSPGQWLVSQRLDLARHLLETTDHSVDRIAASAGFGTAASLRQHLHTTLGVSPHAYRRTFSRA